MKGPRADLSPLPEFYKKLEPWYQQNPLVTTWFLGSLRQIWVSLSWSLDLLYSLRSWIFYLVRYSRYLLPLSKVLGMGGRHQEKYPSSVKIVGEAQLEDTKRIPTWLKKTLGGGGNQLRTPKAALKHTEKFPVERHRWGQAWFYWEIPRAGLKDTEVTPL